MSVFRRTSGLRGEDVSTEILAYMLSPDGHGTLQRRHFVPLQKLFFLRVCGKARSSADLGAEVVTQQAFDVGIPDALILIDDALILVENKLGSYLSGDNQLIRYLEVLKDNPGITRAFPTFAPELVTRRVLVLLAPRSIAFASVRQSEERALRDHGVTFAQLCEESRVSFVRLDWEDLVGDLDMGDALQRELAFYVQDYIEQEMTMSEREALKNTDVPAALEKLFARLSGIQARLTVAGYRAGRMGQSYNYYGFSIEHEALKLWFGYSLPQWGTYGTPVFLQLREEWVTAVREPVVEAIQRSRFIKDERLEWVLPFKVDEIDSWPDRLNDVLTVIAEGAGQSCGIGTASGE